MVRPPARLPLATLIVAPLTALLVLLLAPDPARACGCFTPPDPSVPVVQAGERILFATTGDEIIAHIQIQFAGKADEFGWLLPLPSVPDLVLGTDELFTQLIAQTQPKYRLQRVFGAGCNSPGGRGGGNFASADSGSGPTVPKLVPPDDDPSPLVIEDSIGPFDFAVLKADSKKEMLAWLDENRYFVPVGTDDVVAPYINPGAFFLALKLRSGKASGDLQPVVLRYKSDLPMIPIVLTSVTAQRNMGVQVWMLGPGRAIPRNYYHSVLNDGAIDWLNSGANYNDLIIRAVEETPERHTFVTEFSGDATVMDNVLDPPGRFGDPATMRTLLDPVQYVDYLGRNGFGTRSTNGGRGGPVIQQIDFPSPLIEVLKAHIPLPPSLEQQGVTAPEYYGRLSFYLGDYRRLNPDAFAGLDFAYDPVKLTAEILERVVEPVLQAAKLFDDFPTLTRLYTTLSPEDMNKDPVFSFNPDLPSYGNIHTATITYTCDTRGVISGGTLETADGFRFSYPKGVPGVPLDKLPATRRLEILREAGEPEVLKDNTPLIHLFRPQDQGCSVAGIGGPRNSRGGPSGALFALLLPAALLLLRQRRPQLK